MSGIGWECVAVMGVSGIEWEWVREMERQHLVFHGSATCCVKSNPKPFPTQSDSQPLYELHLALLGEKVKTPELV